MDASNYEKSKYPERQSQNTEQAMQDMHKMFSCMSDRIAKRQSIKAQQPQVSRKDLKK
jgi:hypothetical protein